MTFDSLVFKTTNCKNKAKTNVFKAKVKTKSDLQDQFHERNFCKKYKTVIQLMKEEDNSRLADNLFRISRILVYEIDFL